MRQSLISQRRILPCSFPTAMRLPLGDKAALETLPSGDLSVVQFLYTGQFGRCTSRNAFFFHLEAKTSICPSTEKARCEMGVVSWSKTRAGFGFLGTVPFSPSSPFAEIHSWRSYM